MKSVLKMLCLFIIAFAVIISFAYTVLPSVYSSEVLRPILSVCLALAIGYAVGRIRATFTKRYTTATGV